MGPPIVDGVAGGPNGRFCRLSEAGQFIGTERSTANGSIQLGELADPCRAPNISDGLGSSRAAGSARRPSHQHRLAVAATDADPVRIAGPALLAPPAKKNVSASTAESTLPHGPGCLAAPTTTPDGPQGSRNGWLGLSDSTSSNVLWGRMGDVSVGCFAVSLGFAVPCGCDRSPWSVGARTRVSVRQARGACTEPHRRAGCRSAARDGGGLIYSEVGLGFDRHPVHCLTPLRGVTR